VYVEALSVELTNELMGASYQSLTAHFLSAVVGDKPLTLFDECRPLDRNSVAVVGVKCHLPPPPHRYTLTVTNRCSVPSQEFAICSSIYFETFHCISYRNWN
jgi:hypothetical protein